MARTRSTSAAVGLKCSVGVDDYRVPVYDVGSGAVGVYKYHILAGCCCRVFAVVQARRVLFCVCVCGGVDSRSLWRRVSVGC
jgi:hypothetical protein